MKHINDIDKHEYELLMALYRKSTESESIHEANAFGAKFLDRLDKAGISFDDWTGNKLVEKHIRIKIIHKKLFFHSLWVIFGKEYYKHYEYVYSARGNRVKTEFYVRGPMQLVAEFYQYFLFHCDNFDQEADIFLLAYIHAQDMYGEAFDTKEESQELSAEMLAKARKVGQLSSAISREFKKYIP